LELATCGVRLEEQMDKLQVKFPYDIRDVDAETNAELLEYFKGWWSALAKK